jgi:hypothetical protein
VSGPAPGTGKAHQQCDRSVGTIPRTKTSAAESGRCLPAWTRALARCRRQPWSGGLRQWPSRRRQRRENWPAQSRGRSACVSRWGCSAVRDAFHTCHGMRQAVRDQQREQWRSDGAARLLTTSRSAWARRPRRRPPVQPPRTGARRGRRGGEENSALCNGTTVRSVECDQIGHKTSASLAVGRDA